MLTDSKATDVINKTSKKFAEDLVKLSLHSCIYNTKKLAEIPVCLVKEQYIVSIDTEKTLYEHESKNIRS